VYAGEEQSEGEIFDWLSVASVISKQGYVSIEQDDSEAKSATVRLLALRDRLRDGFFRRGCHGYGLGW